MSLGCGRLLRERFGVPAQEMAGTRPNLAGDRPTSANISPASTSLAWKLSAAACQPRATCRAQTASQEKGMKMSHAAEINDCMGKIQNFKLKCEARGLRR